MTISISKTFYELSERSLQSHQSTCTVTPKILMKTFKFIFLILVAASSVKSFIHNYDQCAASLSVKICRGLICTYGLSTYINSQWCLGLLVGGVHSAFRCKNMTNVTISI